MTGGGALVVTSGRVWLAWGNHLRALRWARDVLGLPADDRRSAAMMYTRTGRRWPLREWLRLVASWRADEAARGIRRG